MCSESPRATMTVFAVRSVSGGGSGSRAPGSPSSVIIIIIEIGRIDLQRRAAVARPEADLVLLHDFADGQSRRLGDEVEEVVLHQLAGDGPARPGGAVHADTAHGIAAGIARKEEGLAQHRRLVLVVEGAHETGEVGDEGVGAGVAELADAGDAHQFGAAPHAAAAVAVVGDEQRAAAQFVAQHGLSRPGRSGCRGRCV